MFYSEFKYINFKIKFTYDIWPATHVNWFYADTLKGKIKIQLD
jgi:hypothetical protein